MSEVRQVKVANFGIPKCLCWHIWDSLSYYGTID